MSKKKNTKTPSAMSQVHNQVNSGLMLGVCYGGMEEGAEPESDKYNIGTEPEGNLGYGHVMEEKEENFDYKKSMKSIARFMKKEGIHVYPFPKVKINNAPQDGLFIMTGYYSPEEKTITVFTNGRHPKDVLRTFAHEMIHHSQNMDGKDLAFYTNLIGENDKLEKIEGEAYLKGNIYFRKWTDEEKKRGLVSEGFDSSVTNGININVDNYDWLRMILNGQKTVETRSGKSYNMWKKHIGEKIGLVKTTKKRGEVTGVLSGYAKIHDVIYYPTRELFEKDATRHCCGVDGEYTPMCGLVLTDVEELETPVKLKARGQQALRPIAVDYNYENISEDVNPEDINLASFKVKDNLNPKFWKDGKLDSRIRMALLDLADDFIEFTGVEWVKPKDVIMTGSLANYNWNGKYSDVDLHIVMDFSKVDKRTDFVRNFFTAQAKLWNEQHKDIKIHGFSVEVYVQDAEEEHASSGVYSLDKNKWLEKPEKGELTDKGLDKEAIKEKVADYMNQVDELDEQLNSMDNDNYATEQIFNKSKNLFDKIKAERKDSLKGKGTEMTEGNIVFKCLRRLNYIEKIINIRNKAYNLLNSID